MERKLCDRAFDWHVENPGLAPQRGNEMKKRKIEGTKQRNGGRIVVSLQGGNL